MRGLITVKLANEQVNYGAKFRYKKCHFSERCSSSRAESLKQAVGEDGVEQEERQRTNRSFPISVSRKVSSFCNSELRSTAFEVERKRLRRWAFFFFFSRGNFFPLPFPLTQETASAPSSTPAFYPVSLLIGFHLYTSVEPLGRLRSIFFLLLFLFRNGHVQKINFWVIALSLQGHLRTWKLNSWGYLPEKRWTD